MKKTLVIISLLMVSLGIINGVNAQIVETAEPNIQVDGNTVTVTLHLSNPTSENSGNQLVELQLRDNHWPLSYVGPENVCNPSYPWNVHRIYNLDAGESQDITLSSTREDGSYYIYLVSVDKCCVDTSGNPVSPECVDETPYGLYGKYINTVTLGSGGTGNWLVDFFLENWIYIIIVVELIIIGAVLIGMGGGKS